MRFVHVSVDIRWTNGVHPPGALSLPLRVTPIQRLDTFFP